MEKFEMKAIVDKLIVETDGKMKQAQIMSRFAARKSAGKQDKATWEKMDAEQQQSVAASKEFLDFLEEIKPEYE